MIAELDADIVGLQEVDSCAGAEGGLDQLEALARKSGLTPLAGPTLRRHSGHMGNGVLTRLPIESHRLLDLSVPGREPRGAIDVTLAAGAGRVRVLVTHFGLRGAERRAQCIRLVSALDDREEALTVLLGDLNEWAPFGRSLRLLGQRLPGSGSVRTFPAPWPVLALDRIVVAPASALRRVTAHGGRLARLASDHLPLRAEIELPPAGPPGS